MKYNLTYLTYNYTLIDQQLGHRMAKYTIGV